MIKPRARIFFISDKLKNVSFVMKLILLFVSYRDRQSTESKFFKFFWKWDNK